MENLSYTLSQLKSLQEDLNELQKLKESVSSLREQKSNFQDSCSKQGLPPKPTCSHSQSKAMEEQAREIDWDYKRLTLPVAIAATVALILIGIILMTAYDINEMPIPVLYGFIGAFLIVFSCRESVTGMVIWGALIVFYSVLYNSFLLADAQFFVFLCFGIIAFTIGFKIYRFIKNSIDADALRRRAKLCEEQERAAYEQALSEYNRECEIIREKNLQENQDALEDYDRQIDRLEDQIRSVRSRVSANSVLAEKDKDPGVIRFVINKIEGKRVGSLQDALNQYDDDLRRANEIIRQGDLEAERRRQAAMRDAERYLDQMVHNMEVQRQQRRQADELERIRKSLED